GCGSTRRAARPRSAPASSPDPSPLADLKTAITEVVTGLGMCGDDDVGVALKDRPDALENVSSDDFRRLGDAWNDGQHRDLFVASFMNGQAFLRASDALRGRPP